MSFEHVEEAQKKLFKLADELCRPPASEKLRKELFHYTTAEGFIGIVTTRSLWASDMLCLGDGAEAEYAFGLIENVLDKEVPSIPHVHRNEFVGMLRKGNFRMYQPFVACFCESGDLLSQWRGYGSGGEGFALGFKMSWLSSLERIGFAVRRVFYERRRQRQLISEYLRGALDLLSRYDFSADDRKWFWGHAAVPIADLVVAFKSPAFREEREWRIVNSKIIGGEHFKYRRTGPRIVPYVGVPIKDKAAFTGVVRGPFFAGTDVRGAEHLLLYSGFTGASENVSDSNVPLRR